MPGLEEVDHNAKSGGLLKGRFHVQVLQRWDEFAVETTRDMDPERNGTRVMSGLMKAHITVYSPGEYAHPSLPTLRDFLFAHTDPNTGLLSYDRLGPKLVIDPAPLRKGCREDSGTR
jgi:hypothetical protein